MVQLELSFRIIAANIGRQPTIHPKTGVAAGMHVAEGADELVTLTAIPAPTSTLTVNVDLSQQVGFATIGSQTVAISVGGGAQLSAATKDDSTAKRMVR